MALIIVHTAATISSDTGFFSSGQSCSEWSRQPLDETYARAMEEVAQRYPDDLHAQTLAAAAMMNTTRRVYWNKDGSPKPITEKFVALLESVIERDPTLTGANHYYIHAVESSQTPNLGVPSAVRLGKLAPGAGHLVHMSGHIYLRAGRYSDATEANIRTTNADEDYMVQCATQGIYPVGSYQHNTHFLWAASALEGRSQVAMNAAGQVGNKVKENYPHAAHKNSSRLQAWMSVPYNARVRFGQWQTILKEPSSSEDLRYITGMWHYARGIALTALGRVDEAGGQLSQLEDIAHNDKLGRLGFVPANDVMKIACHVLAGELAAKQKAYDEAITHFKEAVNLQDNLPYIEPPPWNYPTRQSLGAVLLEAEKPAEAEAVYRKDLTVNPDNGWSLFGLLKSLRAEGKMDAARDVEIRFQRAWARADITLTGSRF